MKTLPAQAPTRFEPGEPVWDLARFFPAQGAWDETHYLELDQAGNTLVEFIDGCIEVLPMPTQEHQRIVLRLLLALNQFAQSRKLGEALPAPLPLKLRPGLYREPDIAFVLTEHRAPGDYLERVDIVFEIVSSGKSSRERDYKSKRSEYAEAGIPEYWIVDPRQECITVLKLVGNEYVEHGVFKSGRKAESVLLAGFGIKVGELLRE